MIVEISVGVVIGVILGMLLTLSIITTGWMRPRILRKVLNSNTEGWLIIQRGQRYSIQPAEHADGGLTVEIGEETHHYERPEMMHDLMGVPVGLALAGPSSLVDVEAAAGMEHLEHQEDICGRPQRCGEGSTTWRHLRSPPKGSRECQAGREGKQWHGLGASPSVWQPVCSVSPRWDHGGIHRWRCQRWWWSESGPDAHAMGLSMLRPLQRHMFGCQTPGVIPRGVASTGVHHG